MIFRVGHNELDLRFPQVMGVLNVTPDSFSDGGTYFDQDSALRRAESVLAEGASIIDIGGESTRPGARAVSVQEELDRVVPIIEAIANRLEIGISVDTSKPEVMTAAAAAGAGMINDVFALRMDGALQAAMNTPCALCLMHMQGRPGNMQENPVYNDVVQEIRSFLEKRVAACTAIGIDRERIVIDPGFGFGKSDDHNIEVLAKLDVLQLLGQPILVGLSRKRTLGALTGRDLPDRAAAGIAAAAIAFLNGANIIRSHDVAATVDSLKIAAAVRDQAMP